MLESFPVSPLRQFKSDAARKRRVRSTSMSRRCLMAMLLLVVPLTSSSLESSEPRTSSGSSLMSRFLKSAISMLPRKSVSSYVPLNTLTYRQFLTKGKNSSATGTKNTWVDRFFSHSLASNLSDTDDSNSSPRSMASSPTTPWLTSTLNPTIRNKSQKVTTYVPPSELPSEAPQLLQKHGHLSNYPNPFEPYWPQPTSSFFHPGYSWSRKELQTTTQDPLATTKGDIIWIFTTKGAPARIRRPQTSRPAPPKTTLPVTQTPDYFEALTTIPESSTFEGTTAMDMTTTDTTMNHNAFFKLNGNTIKGDLEEFGSFFTTTSAPITDYNTELPSTFESRFGQPFDSSTIFPIQDNTINDIVLTNFSATVTSSPAVVNQFLNTLASSDNKIQATRYSATTLGITPLQQDSTPSYKPYLSTTTTTTTTPPPYFQRQQTSSTTGYHYLPFQSHRQTPSLYEQFLGQSKVSTPWQTTKTTKTYPPQDLQTWTTTKPTTTQSFLHVNDRRPSQYPDNSLVTRVGVHTYPKATQGPDSEGFIATETSPALPVGISPMKLKTPTYIQQATPSSKTTVSYPSYSSSQQSLAEIVDRVTGATESSTDLSSWVTEPPPWMTTPSSSSDPWAYDPESFQRRRTPWAPSTMNSHPSFMKMSMSTTPTTYSTSDQTRPTTPYPITPFPLTNPPSPTPYGITPHHQSPESYYYTPPGDSSYNQHVPQKPLSPYASGIFPSPKKPLKKYQIGKPAFYDNLSPQNARPFNFSSVKIWPTSSPLDGGGSAVGVEISAPGAGLKVHVNKHVPFGYGVAQSFSKRSTTTTVRSTIDVTPLPMYTTKFVAPSRGAESEATSYVIVNVWNYVGDELRLIGVKHVPLSVFKSVPLEDGGTIHPDEIPHHVLDYINSAQLIPVHPSTPAPGSLSDSFMPALALASKPQQQHYQRYPSSTPVPNVTLKPYATTGQPTFNPGLAHAPLSPSAFYTKNNYSAAVYGPSLSTADPKPNKRKPHTFVYDVPQTSSTQPHPYYDSESAKPNQPSYNQNPMFSEDIHIRPSSQSTPPTTQTYFFNPYEYTSTTPKSTNLALKIKSPEDALKLFHALLSAHRFATPVNYAPSFSSDKHHYSHYSHRDKHHPSSYDKHQSSTYSDKLHHSPSQHDVHYVSSLNDKAFTSGYNDKHYSSGHNNDQHFSSGYSNIDNHPPAYHDGGQSFNRPHSTDVSKIQSLVETLATSTTTVKPANPVPNVFSNLAEMVLSTPYPVRPVNPLNMLPDYLLSGLTRKAHTTKPTTTTTPPPFQNSNVSPNFPNPSSLYASILKNPSLSVLLPLVEHLKRARKEDINETAAALEASWPSAPSSSESLAALLSQEKQRTSSEASSQSPFASKPWEEKREGHEQKMSSTRNRQNFLRLNIRQSPLVKLLQGIFPQHARDPRLSLLLEGSPVERQKRSASPQQSIHQLPPAIQTMTEENRRKILEIIQQKQSIQRTTTTTPPPVKAPPNMSLLEQEAKSYGVEGAPLRFTGPVLAHKLTTPPPFFPLKQISLVLNAELDVSETPSTTTQTTTPMTTTTTSPTTTTQKIFSLKPPVAFLSGLQGPTQESFKYEFYNHDETDEINSIQYSYFDRKTETVPSTTHKPDTTQETPSTFAFKPTETEFHIPPPDYPGVIVIEESQDINTIQELGSFIFEDRRAWDVVRAMLMSLVPSVALTFPFLSPSFLFGKRRRKRSIGGVDEWEPGNVTHDSQERARELAQEIVQRLEEIREVWTKKRSASRR